MEELPLLADLAIRRACGFGSLAIGTVMLSLSFDLPLAFRTGASLTSIFCCALVLLAWRANRRDVRRTEFWAMFAARNPQLVAGRDTARLQATARRVWHDRLVWHAERVGLAAVALWIGAGIALAAQALAGG
jgi:hypothetical protein